VATKKSWKQKIETAPEPHVDRLAKDFGGGKAGDLMFIASPRLVRDYVAAIPRGQTREVLDMRGDFARQNAADVTCPITSSIFLRIVSEAAIDEMKAGASPDEVTPFWRIVAPSGPIASKLSCDKGFIAAMRRKESAA
jgi:hypothetical protein